MPRRGERGFTVLELIVAIAVLAVIIVPLTTSFVLALRQSASVQDRLDQSADAQRIGAAWTKDVQSLDKAGEVAGLGCPGLKSGFTGTPLITFQADVASVASGSGQAALVPKQVSWVLTGANKNMQLLRRYCENGAPVSETVLASHFGVSGQSYSQTIHADDSSQNYCTAKACTIVVDGAFKYRLEVSRRVTNGGVNNLQTVPPPTITSATARNRYITVAWTPPSVPNGTPPVNGYRVEAWTTPNGGVAGFTEIDASSNAADITGLSNDVQYWVVAYSRNAAGQGEPSPPFGPVVPVPTVPSLPLTVAVTQGTNVPVPSMTVSWTAPTDDGGQSITSYEVQAVRQRDGQTVPPVTVSGSVLTATVPSLSAGDTYSFRVRALNGVGWGPLSDPVTANTRPPQPTGITVTAGAKKAIVGFTVAGNGNVVLASTKAVTIIVSCVPSTACPNQSYNIDYSTSPSYSSPNGSVIGLDTSSDSAGPALVNGQTYILTARLKNGDGVFGPPSNASAPFTPVGKPGSPTSVVSINATGASSILRFTLASGLVSNGSPITSYVVTDQSASARTTTIAAAADGSATFDWNGAAGGQPVFANFTNYTFKVSACNAQGCTASPDLVAAPGVAPTATVTATKGGAGRQVVMSANTGAGTADAGTTWAFACPSGPSQTTGSGTGSTPSATLTDVTVGPVTCTGSGTNTVPNVTNGVAGTVVFKSPTSSASVNVDGSAPKVLQVNGTKTISVESGSQDSNANQFRALALVRTDPGVAVTGLRYNLYNSERTYSAANMTETKVVSDSVYDTHWIWIDIKPTAGDWAGIGSADPRVVNRNASFGFRTDGTTVNSDNATLNYWAVSEFDNNVKREDLPAVWSTGQTPSFSGNGLADRTSAGATISVQYTCQDNDAYKYHLFSANDDDGRDNRESCDSARLRLRRLDAPSEVVVGLACTTNCESQTSNSNQVKGNFNADDDTARSYSIALPNTVGSGVWVIEGGFCNEDGRCPSNAPSGYGERSGAGQGDPVGGTDWQMLGSFYIA